MRLGPDGGSWKKGIYELEPTRQGSSTISQQCDHNIWNEGVSDCKAPSPFSSQHHSSTESDSSSLAFSLPPSLPPSLSLSLSLTRSPSSHCFRVGQIRSPFQGVALFILLPSQSGTEERDTFNNQRTRWKEQRTINSEWLGLSKTLNRQREGVCVCVCVCERTGSRQWKISPI